MPGLKVSSAVLSHVIMHFSVRTYKMKVRFLYPSTSGFVEMLWDCVSSENRQTCFVILVAAVGLFGWRD